MIQGGFLAYLLIRLSGADREVMEKWLYVIVGLVFIAGILGTAHHYYWVGVPAYWLPIGGIFSALEPVALVGMAIYAYSAMRRSGIAHPNTLALHWTLGSAVFTLFGAGLLGLAHTFPDVNKWTHGTLITAMHGHAAFYGAYAMIMLAMITYALPAMTPGRSRAGQQHRLLVVLAADRRHVRHDLVVRDRRHRAGLSGAHPRHGLSRRAAEDPGALRDAAWPPASIFAIGVGLFIYDFFRHAPRFEVERRDQTPAAAAGGCAPAS